MILTSPTEVAKVRLQTQTQAQAQVRAQLQAQAQCWRSSASCPALPVTLGSGPKYRGPLHCLATVAREEGLRGLYKGSSALLLRDSFSFATYFLSYSILCEWLAPTGRSQPGEEGPGLGSGGSRASGDQGWEKEPWMSQARPPSAPRVGTEVPLSPRVSAHCPMWPWTSEPRPPLGLGPALGPPTRFRSRHW